LGNGNWVSGIWNASVNRQLSTVICHLRPVTPPTPIAISPPIAFFGFILATQMELQTPISFTSTDTLLYATVILPLAVPTTYTYAVPPHLQAQAQPGCRAEVVFGKQKKYAGIIKSVSANKPAWQTKELLNVLDDEPLLYPQQLQLWQWMAQYYMCSEGEVMAAALPVHFKLSSESVLQYNEEYGEDFSQLNDEEFIVAEALLIKKELRLGEVQQLLDSSHVYPVIKRLIDKKVCVVWQELSERYKTKKENFVLLHPNLQNEAQLAEVMNNWSKAPKQLELLLSFLHLQKTLGTVAQPELLKKAGATAAQLKGLVEKEVLVVERRSIDRIKILPKEIAIDFELNAQQQSSLAAVEQTLAQKSICLLHGVTGSGKTQLYIKLMARHFEQGQQVLYLLPEIALTTQVIRRLQKHFGGNIAIYHSKFNDNERIELWHRIRSGEVRMLVGPRSALFLPFQNLGLVIVDEEHDPSYKQQEPAPRYHARDAAIYYAGLFGAKVVLGSATPSVESYFNASNGKYGLVTLNERFGGIELPAIEFVNTRQVAAKGKVMISPQLQAAMEQTLAEGNQVILFQNRRGYDPYLFCNTCHFIPKCQHCEVSLTWHKSSHKLHCHYCGSTYAKLVTCPACGSTDWGEKNFGTEKIEEELDKLLPKHRIARMDVDSVRGKTAHDSMIQLFEQRRIDVLVGTQMVVKGLDFDNVALVGILDADGLLSFADFRVHERAFQLMEQVSGRAGRKHQQGRVMIQTANPKHPVLLWVQQHDYVQFYQAELYSRREFFYPPFSRIVQLTLRHKDKAVVDGAANRLGNLLRQDLKDYTVGPAAPVIGRIRNQYIMELMIKLPKEHGKSGVYKKVIANHINLLHSETAYKGVVVVANVDPV
jgi:primosomal protein N' (replication factor Y) (superfamily II helicase)